MAIIKCKMCGGDMELAAVKTFGTCEFCGSTMTLPKIDDDQRAAAFNRGNHFRRIGEFDKALAVYERIVREDDTDAVDFSRIGKDLYFLDSKGDVWLADTRENGDGIDWMAQFCPFYETIQGRKRYTKLLMRLELPKGAWMKAEIRSDGGNWRECGKVLGQDMDTVPMQIPIHRCDCFELRLSGSGPCTIRTMMLEYQVGSDV
jgi:hypothetical protein